MTTIFGLTPEHIERIQNGETVEFTVPGLINPGYNATVEIEAVDTDAQRTAYANDLDLRDHEGNWVHLGEDDE